MTGKPLARGTPAVTAERVYNATREPKSRTPDAQEDTFTLVGAFFASLATTWLLYFHVLPFSGKVGFVIAWYLVFVLFYAGLTALAQPRAVVADRVVSTAIIGAPTLVGVALASMVIYTVGHGLRALVHPNFFTQDMSGVRPLDSLNHGGILHAIVGTADRTGHSHLLSRCPSASPPLSISPR